MTDSVHQDAHMSERNSLSRARSPSDIGPGSDRKRRRKVLSCYDCRRRKLQCDRQMPACSRCTKAGQATSCLYIDDASEAPPRPMESARPDLDTRRGPFDANFSRPIQGSSGDMLHRLEYQDNRIKQLEAALENSARPEHTAVQSLKGVKLPLTPESVQAHDIGGPATDRETMLLRGKSFKTQFHGTTHPSSLIAHVPDLNSFTKEAFERFPALQRIRQDMHALEERTAYAGSHYEKIEDAEIRALLPPREDVDKSIKLYFDTYGAIYHIIHLPSFWKAYDTMWIQGSQETSAHFIALVLLMIASVSCLSGIQPWLYVANSSSARETSAKIIHNCDVWIKSQSQKHVTAADFQIRCLLWLAKQSSARKFKRTWTEAGDLLRFCMSAGLHRSPELLRKPTTALDKELRRRVWACVVDFELQASFDRGMISAPWLLQSDCEAPGNIDDEDFAFDQAPASRNRQDFTYSSYLCLSADTLNLRSTLNAVLNNIRHTITFDEVKQYSDEIELRIHDIPNWIGATSEGPRTLLILKLLQYQLAIHDRFLRSAGTFAERNFSRVVIMDTATKVIDIHRVLLDQKNPALEVMCQDQLRAAMSLAHLASTLDPSADGALADIIEQKTPGLMDDVVEMLTDKVVRFGREQRMLWIALAARGYLKSRKNPSLRAACQQEAVDKITQPYYKIMACQEEGAATSVTSLGAYDLKVMERGMIEYLPTVSGSNSKENELGNLADPTLLDFDGLDSWTFEDWMLNPLDFQQDFAQPYDQPPLKSFAETDGQ